MARDDFAVKPGIDIFQGLESSIDDLRASLSNKFVFNGLVRQASHVVIYGPSGSGKSTITNYLLPEALLNIPELKVFYMNLDGSDEITINTSDFLNNDPRVKFYNEAKASDLLYRIQTAIETEQDLSNTLFIFDTLKKFQTDINSKSANTLHFDLIRKATMRGATCISIAHSNKDGGTFSGTAELEQDSDAVFRFDSAKDLKDENKLIVSVVEGGRVRWQSKERSFTIPAKDPNFFMIKEIDFVDVRSWITEDEDMYLIEMIKDVIEEKPGIFQGDIVRAMQDKSGDGRKTITKLLYTYRDRHWIIKKIGRVQKYFLEAVTVYE